MSTLAHKLCLANADVIAMRCPRCARELGNINRASKAPQTELQCDACFFHMQQDEGIWRALSPEREGHYARFMTEYQIVRTSEGRGSEDSAFYLALPYRDLSGRNAAQWNVRAQTFRALEQEVLPLLEMNSLQPLDILDIGAGNCWLSYRLATRGHRPIAVDLITNNTDGLGAAIHYRKQLTDLFPRFQTDADSMPFASSQFDCVIFNASFHYSEDYVATMAEAVRCLRNDGMVILADTAWYSREESGERMIAERQQAFNSRYGFPSNGLKSLEYLTDSRLDRLAQLFNLNWQMVAPYYGLRWALRPWIARIKGRREPSQFRIYFSEVRK